jgi:hypothetical protein
MSSLGSPGHLAIIDDDPRRTVPACTTSMGDLSVVMTVESDDRFAYGNPSVSSSGTQARMPTRYFGTLL